MGSEQGDRTDLQVRLLGPFEVVQAGRPVPVGSAKQRAVLALLALQAGKVVSSERLCRLLWEDDEPASPTATLQSLVSRLRRALATPSSASSAAPRDVLRTREPGWVLDVDVAAVDALEFEALTARARRRMERGEFEAAAADLAEAVGLWRGSALADVVEAGYLSADATRLDEARLDAIEDLAEAELAVGRPAEALARLEPHVEANPFRERAWGQLMIALYRLGRQAAALRTFQRVRAILGDELGLDPSPALADIEQRILNHDPALAGPPGPESSPPEPVHADADPAVASMPSPPPPRRSPGVERRQLSVMVCDLVGSTALSTVLDPEDLSEVIGDYHRRVADVVTRFEGHVTKYLGDRVLALFGYPLAHENETERAVLAALELIETVRSLPRSSQQRIDVRVGIATGLTVVGDSPENGSGGGPEVVGETPLLATRLQALAEPGTVVISDTTRQLLAALFEVADLGRHPLEGFPEPVPAWRVLRANTTDGRFEAMHGGQLTPVVGRDHELELLVDRWEQAKDGEGQVVVISGEPGIGKSRVVQALRERLVGEDYTALSHYCSPYHTNTALYPVISMLERASRLNRNDSPATQREQLRSLLALSATDLAEAEPLLAALLSIPVDLEEPLSQLPAQRQKQRTLEILLDQLGGLAASGPVLSIYEDVHWADPSTLELLQSMVDQVQNLPVLLVLTCRPGFTPPSVGFAHVTALTLSRLPQRRVSSMIDRLTGGKQLPPEIVEQILAKTDGVPLYVEELTKLVLQAGLVRESSGRLVLSGALTPLAIPATLNDSLMARLDLSPFKHVAQIAATIGREFSYDLLKAVADRPEEELCPALDQLVESELIFRRGVPPGATYSFKHALVRDAAYEALLKARRRELHARIAATLSSEATGDVGSSFEVIAEHLSRAGLHGDAAAYWLRAAERAKATYANVEAVSHVNNCLVALEQASRGETPPEHAEMSTRALTLLGDLAGLAGDLKAANRHYERALSVAQDPQARISIANRLHHQDSAVRERAEIVFYRHGNGRQTLLLVNPLVYGLAVFQPILERLGQDFRIITVDCRGTGDSSPLVRPFPLREHARDVAAVIEALGGEPVVGVGLSRGSNLFIRLAAERPELVSKLVTVGCPLLPGGFEGLEAFSGYWVECPKAHERADVEALLRILSTYMYTEPGTAHLKKTLVEAGLQLASETVLSFYDADPDVDVSSLLPDIGVPALVTHGRADELIPFSAAEYLAGALPHGHLHAFEGKGHLPIFTAPDEFCSVLRDFVAGGSMSRRRAVSV